MATSNRDRVTRLLDLVATGLRPVVEQTFSKAYGDAWVDTVRAETEAATGKSVTASQTDPQFLLGAIWHHWNQTLGRMLGVAERSYVAELRDTRNRWAHPDSNRPFTADDVYRACDTAERLLKAVSAPEAAELTKLKLQVLREGYEQATRQEVRRVASAPTTTGTPVAGLAPWRQLVEPHPDVALGRYRQAEFAADLAQVHRGEAAAEYQQPTEFFARTFLTDGLRLLLETALLRLSGKSGEPVVELQTNFGGGKTHSMLALFHVVDPQVSLGQFAGLEATLAKTGVVSLPPIRRVVLVGSALPPGQTHRRDGIDIRTMWGELAWQLGGDDAYARIADSDRHGVSPGSDALRELLVDFGPALILIDEWVTFVRQLWATDGLPAGSFDANLSFTQALTEAVKATPTSMLVASLPSSEIEIGGEGGKAALARLQDTFGRVESPWRPASSEEGFEIVRRRLFQPLPAANAAARDAVLQHFNELYAKHTGDFPPDTKEAAYLRRMERAYPIHPELFDRLFGTWSTLERFQQTRGVLKLMAAVVHSLYERNDAGLLILPSSIPLDDPRVYPQLTQYLEENWPPVLESDVDGPASLPLQLDRDNPAFARYRATVRVARTVFLGSAPIPQAANRGIDDQHVKLGAVQPGEPPATFGDALRKLSSRATYLYEDKSSYWYATQASVNRVAQDRAQALKPDVIAEEITRRLKANVALDRGLFARVHTCPMSNADVPDDDEVGLVILAPEYPHSTKTGESKARAAAQSVLADRGAGARMYRNALVFLAADATRLAELDLAVREYLAWASIVKDATSLDLSAFQAEQAKAKLGQADSTVDARIPETYMWLLVPGQNDPMQGEPAWAELRLTGQGSLASRAGKKLLNDDLLKTEWGGANLRLELDKYPAMWGGDDVGLAKLWTYFASYLYLPRLRDRSVLAGAVEKAVGSLVWRTEGLAYAEAKDADGKYRGLVGGRPVRAVVDGSSLIVKPEVAGPILDSVQVPTPVPTGTDHDGTPTVSEGGPRPRSGRPRRFHAVVELSDPRRPVPQFSEIAQHVVGHLAGVTEASLRVRVEIEAEHRGDGFSETVERTVSENARTLKFSGFGFEDEA
jgi:predicted AAA+ superfamily ATPase